MAHKQMKNLDSNIRAIRKHHWICLIDKTNRIQYQSIGKTSEKQTSHDSWKQTQTTQIHNLIISSTWKGEYSENQPWKLTTDVSYSPV